MREINIVPSVYRDQLKHDVESYDCWCRPRFYLPCDECDGTGCWKCSAGLIELTRAEADAAEQSLIVVHSNQ